MIENWTNLLVVTFIVIGVAYWLANIMDYKKSVKPKEANEK